MMHSYSVMVSTSVEGDTNQASNLGGTKIILSLVATQKRVAGRQPVAPVVGLGPPTKG